MNVIATTLGATLLIQGGYFLWKLSADGQPQIGRAGTGAVLRALLTDWRWLLGLLFTVGGWLLFVQATSLGDISLVQPLMSAGDVLLVVMAVLFLRERLGRWEWIGVLVTVAGAAALAAQPEAAGGPIFDTGRLWTVIGLATACGVAILWWSRGTPRVEVAWAFVVGLAFGSGSVLTKALANRAAQARHDVLSMSTLVDPMLLAVVASNVAGLVLLQGAFQRGRAAVIVPVQLALANALTVVTGVAVFGEQVSALRALGIALIVAGTVALHAKPDGAGKSNSLPA